MELQQIRQELEAKIKEIEPIGKKLKFDLDGNYMLIDGTGAENVMRDEDEEADCTVTMSVETYLKIQRKELKPLKATLTRKLKVKGDLSVARKLRQLM